MPILSYLLPTSSEKIFKPACKTVEGSKTNGFDNGGGSIPDFVVKG